MQVGVPMARIEFDMYSKGQTDALLDGKQDALVSGESIKTINGESVMGSGDIAIEQVVVDPQLSTDSENPIQNKAVATAIQSMQSDKQDRLTAGEGISIVDNVISATAMTAHRFNTYGEIKQAVSDVFDSTGRFPIAYYLYEYSVGLTDEEIVRRYIPCTMEKFVYDDVTRFYIRGAYTNLMYGEGYSLNYLYLALGFESGMDNIPDTATSVDYYIFMESRALGGASGGDSQRAHTFQMNKFILYY